MQNPHSVSCESPWGTCWTQHRASPSSAQVYNHAALKAPSFSTRAATTWNTARRPFLVTHPSRKLREASYRSEGILGTPALLQAEFSGPFLKGSHSILVMSWPHTISIVTSAIYEHHDIGQQQSLCPLCILVFSTMPGTWYVLNNWLSVKVRPTLPLT